MTTDLERFRELCAAYGAARHRWPPEMQAMFDRHAQTPDGRQALTEAARLDDWLNTWHAGTDDASRTERIVSAARALPERRRAVRWVASGLAACMMLGFAVGYLQASSEDSERELYAELVLANSMVGVLQ